MPWTPQDLTSTQFVRTQLSPLDRSNALQTMTQNQASVQKKLDENKAALEQVQELTNGPYSFATVRNAKQAAQAAIAAGDPNAAELQKTYEELQARRSELNGEAAKLLGYVQDGESAINTAQLGINNLESAGAEPPGTNQFSAPLDYESTINPPAEVPDDENPNPVYEEPDESIENVEPVTIDEEDPFEAARLQREEDFNAEAPTEASVEAQNTRGISAPLFNTQSQATQQDSTNAYSQGDWRVRLSLAPGSKYLYNNKGKEGILLPLKATQGVLFPYTPTISVSYAAAYDATDLTHSNYKMFQYKSSSVDSISISCDFTAQDTFEANYLLAVIHFFRSVTKMFYGQDQNPVNGTPPPLCYLTGMGAFQFDRHPLAITSFQMSLPSEVDYIRAGSTTAVPGANQQSQNVKYDGVSTSENRLGGGIGAGGTNPAPVFQQSPAGSREATYVPTKMQIQIAAIPIVSRNDISNRFSLAEYGTGSLLRGSRNKGTGIW